MALVYAIPMMITSQKEALDAHCFGDCGKISMAGMIDMEDVGPCLVCVHVDCPYEKGHTPPFGTSQLTGDEVCVRALQMERK